MAALEVTSEQLARFDLGWCPRCLGICACKRCINKPCAVVGGGAPVFDHKQRREFATHMLAVLKPHVDAYLAARDEEVRLTPIFTFLTIFVWHGQFVCRKVFYD